MKTYSTKKIIFALLKASAVIVATLAIAWVVFFSKSYLSYSSYAKERVLIKNSIFVGYVVDNEISRTKGLSGKPFLPSNTLMLFEFDKPDIYGIWMKDMKFPIDIIWLDKNKRIVNMISGAEPSTYPHIFYPPKESMYIIEVRSGLIKDKALKLGDEILFGQNDAESASSTKE